MLTYIGKLPEVTFSDVTLTGTLKGPTSFTIDPAAVGDNTGTLIINGDLQVQGTTTTINSTTVNVVDKNIVLASGAANSSAANGAGITIDGASASMTYTSSTDLFTFNKAVKSSGLYDSSDRKLLIKDAAGTVVWGN